MVGGIVTGIVLWLLKKRTSRVASIGLLPFGVAEARTIIGVLGTEEQKRLNRLSLENKVRSGLPYFLDIALKNPFSPERVFCKKR